MNGLLREYYDLMLARIDTMGGSVPGDGEAAIDEFWQQIDLFLPPHGSHHVAQDDSGRWIGCGSLKSIGQGKGELKRLFVRPEARGSGLGRKLVDRRIQDARDMGLKELLVDTLAANVEMRGLYASLGFNEIDIYPESSSGSLVPELIPLMRFFRMELT